MLRLNKKIITAFSAFTLIFTICFMNANAQNRKKTQADFYQIKVYHCTTQAQINNTEQYLKTAFLPALHKNKISKVGVFKAIDNDTAMDKRIYVFIPSPSLEKLTSLDEQFFKDRQVRSDGAAYYNLAYNEAPYDRIETILLKSFTGMPHFVTPPLTAPRTERVYELRSYESPTENLHYQKIKMFNEGSEISIFSRLNFNAVFYADVIAGCHMPNLMYMTSFNSKADRDEHWKQFSADAEWKKLAVVPEYLNSVSKHDINLLRPTEYSDF
ncbi:MAG: NIPSNAP family protein [Ginsengibacter sp.]